MKVDREYVQQRLRRRTAQGLRVDERLLQQIDEPGDMEVRSVTLPAEFLSLIWQARDGSRLLTPQGQPRTLRAVAERMIAAGYSFADLASNL